MDVSIIIVNWNAGELLFQCVNSVIKYSSGLDVEIIVVDNGSSDNSLELISDLAKTKVIETGINMGFGKACNIGSQQACGKYLLFLNPDAEVYVDTLIKTYTFMEIIENNNVAVCGVQLINDFNLVDKSCSRFPSTLNLSSISLGINKLLPKTGMVMSEWSHQDTKIVDQVMGAYFFIRAHVFEQLGGFDERFFVYFEEVDLSFRLKHLSFVSVYLSDIQAYHKVGGVSEKVKATRLFYFNRSKILYSYKHFNFASASMVLFITLFLEPFSRSVYCLIKRDKVSLKEVWIAWAKILVWLPRWILLKQVK